VKVVVKTSFVEGGGASSSLLQELARERVVNAMAAISREFLKVFIDDGLLWVYKDSKNW
jgi:hypothetical protein